MSESEAMAPPGWYPVEDGAQERWWDGQKWSEHLREPQPSSGAEVAVRPTPGRPSRQDRKVARLVQDLQAVPHEYGPALPEGTLWSAVGKPLSGFGAGRYRLDDRYLYFEEGTLRTDSQQVHVAHIIDVDVKQSMTQKARNVFTVLVHAGGQLVKLEDIEDGRLAQQRINEAAHAARLVQQRNDNTVRYEGTHPNTAPAAQVHVHTPAAAPAAGQGAASGDGGGGGGDLMEQLTKLAELRSDGLLSETEFVAAKAKLLA